MAMVTINKKDPLEVAQGITSMVGQVQGMMHAGKAEDRAKQQMQMQLEQAQRQKEAFEFEMQQAEEQKAELKEKQRSLAVDEVQGFVSRASKSGDPKKYFELYGEQFTSVLSKSGLGAAPQEFLGYAAMLKGNAQMSLNDVIATRASLQADPASIDEGTIARVKTAYNTLIDSAEGPIRQMWAKESQEFDGYIDSIAKMREQDKLKKEQIALSGNASKSSNPALSMTPEQRAAGSEIGKSVAKGAMSADNAIAGEFRTDRLLELTDKVYSGPLLGKTLGLQKILGQIGKSGTKEDAQEFDFLIKEIVVGKIMEFAQAAGVRSIDTEKEQKFLKESLANPNLSPAALKAILIRSKMLNATVRARANAKLQFINDPNNRATDIKGMEAAWKGVKVVANTKGEVLTLNPGEEVPSGYYDAVNMKPDLFKGKSDKKQMTEADIDKMSVEELNAYLQSEGR